MNTNTSAKKILCYGDSNTWGWVPGKMGAERYAADKRWPGVLQNLLGSDFEIIENALGARTTDLDDPRPAMPERNGFKSLQGILESQMPLDMVILMLGSTDAKEMFNRSAEEIGQGLEKIIDYIQSFKQINSYPTPKILIVVPPIIDETTEFASKLFKGATEKARQLKDVYKELASKKNCEYLDVTDELKVDKEEGIHLTEESHKVLGERVKKLCVIGNNKIGDSFGIK